MSSPRWDATAIKCARNKRGLTQEELASEIGCRQQTVSEWEMGEYLPKAAYQRVLTMYFDDPESYARIMGNLEASGIEVN